MRINLIAKEGKSDVIEASSNSYIKQEALKSALQRMGYDISTYSTIVFRRESGLYVGVIRIKSKQQPEISQEEDCDFSNVLTFNRKRG